MSGWASGSAFAAAVIALSSSILGIVIAERLDVLDIVLHLATIGLAQADDPPHVATVNTHAHDPIRDEDEDRLG